MDEKIDEEMVSWKRKRQHTTIFAMTHIFFIGVENFAIATSLMYYLQETVKVENPAFWYGIVLTSIIASEALSSIFFGKYMDETLNGKAIVMFNLSLSLIGDLMYTLQYSVWLLIIGRFLCGFSESIQAVATGEFRRCYEDKEFGKIISTYQLLFSLGYIFGPTLSTLLAKDVNFKFYTWVVNRYNAVALLLALFDLLLLISAYVFMSDISKEHDLLTQKNKVKNIDKTKQKQSRTTIIENLSNGETLKLWGWKDFIKCDILLIILPYTLVRFTITLEEPLSYLILINLFEWRLDELSIIISAIGCFSCLATVCVVRSNVFMGQRRLFYVFVLCICGAAILQLQLILPTVVNIELFPMQLLYVIIMEIIDFSVYFTINTVTRYILLNMVPDHSASYMDGFKNALATSARMVATFLTGYTFLYAGYVLTVIALFTLILICLLLLFRKRFESSSP